ncbi:MAG: hypothetical protein HY909_26000 [Deltaproteobacteria bacterium]|nr:hypothetical protein [Deltaproteobacteria bacterium]
MTQVYTVRIPNPRPEVLPSHLVALVAVARLDGALLTAEDQTAIAAAYPDALGADPPSSARSPAPRKPAKHGAASPRGSAAKPRRRAAAKKPVGRR